MTTLESNIEPLSMCVFLCVFNAELCLNACPQLSHMYGFSPVCILKCELRSFDCEKAFVQYLQT